MGSAKGFIWDEAKFTSQDGRPIFVFEITHRVGDGRHMLAPDDKQLVRLHWGVLGQAAVHYDFELYSVHFLSNHGASLVGFYDLETKTRFAQFVGANIAKETNIRRNTSGKLWGRSAKAIQVHTEAVLLDRLIYNLSNGTKENLVAHPNLWPGVHAAKYLEEGKPAVGDWINRTAFWEARKKNPKAKLLEHLEKRPVHFSKLPTLNGQDDATYRDTIRDICAEIARKRREDPKNSACLGVDQVTRKGCWRNRTALKDRTGCSEANLSTQEERDRRTPPDSAPAIHTIGVENRRRFRDAYNDYVEGLTKLRTSLVAAIKEAVEGGRYTVKSLLAGIRNAPA